jgi:hypothetical protein
MKTLSRRSLKPQALGHKPSAEAHAPSVTPSSLCQRSIALELAPDGNAVFSRSTTKRRDPRRSYRAASAVALATAKAAPSWLALDRPVAPPEPFSAPGRSQRCLAPLPRLAPAVAPQPLPRLTTMREAHCGGGERNRTDDLLLAKQALSQLSYTPANSGSARVGRAVATAALLRRGSHSARASLLPRHRAVAGALLGTVSLSR